MEYLTLVVLLFSCGHFTHSNEMMQKYITGLPHIKLKTTLSPTSVEVFAVVNEFLGSMEADRTIRLTGSYEFWWTDTRLKWNKTESEPSCFIISTGHHIFEPDISLIYNMIESRNPNGLTEPSLYVCDNGSVSVSTPWIATLVQQFDLRVFPFDLQQFWFAVGSASYGESEFMIEQCTTIPVNTLHSAEWAQVGHLACVNRLSGWVGRTGRRSFCNCTFQLRRKPRYYVVNFCLPSMATTSLGILALLNPFDHSRHKEMNLDIAIGAILANVMSAIILVQETPKTSHTVPLLIRYCVELNLVLLAAAVLHCIVVMIDQKQQNIIRHVIRRKLRKEDRFCIQPYALNLFFYFICSFAVGVIVVEFAVHYFI